MRRHLVPQDASILSRTTLAHRLCRSLRILRHQFIRPLARLSIAISRCHSLVDEDECQNVDYVQKPIAIHKVINTIGQLILVVSALTLGFVSAQASGWASTLSRRSEFELASVFWSVSWTVSVSGSVSASIARRSAEFLRR